MFVAGHETVLLTYSSYDSWPWCCWWDSEGAVAILWEAVGGRDRPAAPPRLEEEEGCPPRPTGAPLPAPPLPGPPLGAPPRGAPPRGSMPRPLLGKIIRVSLPFWSQGMISLSKMLGKIIHTFISSLRIKFDLLERTCTWLRAWEVVGRHGPGQVLRGHEWGRPEHRSDTRRPWRDPGASRPCCPPETERKGRLQQVQPCRSLASTWSLLTDQARRRIVQGDHGVCYNAYWFSRLETENSILTSSA